MNLLRTSYFTILLNFAVQFPNLESTIVKNKKFNRPCFDEDQDLTQCSAFNELCEKDGINGFKLVRLQGKRVSG